jgi:hypothetical protein
MSVLVWCICIDTPQLCCGVIHADVSCHFGVHSELCLLKFALNLIQFLLLSYAINYSSYQSSQSTKITEVVH